jgi:hypothetical protein
MSSSKHHPRNPFRTPVEEKSNHLLFTNPIWKLLYVAAVVSLSIAVASVGWTALSQLPYPTSPLPSSESLVASKPQQKLLPRKGGGVRRQSRLTLTDLHNAVDHALQSKLLKRSKPLTDDYEQQDTVHSFHNTDDEVEGSSNHDEKELLMLQRASPLLAGTKEQVMQEISQEGNRDHAFGGEDIPDDERDDDETVEKEGQTYNGEDNEVHVIQRKANFIAATDVKSKESGSGEENRTVPDATASDQNEGDAVHQAAERTRLHPIRVDAIVEGEATADA